MNNSKGESISKRIVDFLKQVVINHYLGGEIRHEREVKRPSQTNLHLGGLSDRMTDECCENGQSWEKN